jgi:signal transduction histidine kinase
VASERDMSYPRREPRLPSYPPGGSAAVPAAPSRAPRPPHPPLTQRMRTGHWIAIDFVMAAFTALLVVGLVRSSGVMYPGRPLFLVGLLVAAGVFVPVALRRRAPTMAFGGLLILAVMLSGMTIAASAVIFLAAAYTLYAVTLTGSKRTGVAALGLVLALMVVITATGHHHPPFGLAGAYAPVALANVLAWTTGYSVRQRRLYVVRLQQQAASTAVADERLRIARELHDVVAHSMSVIAVQAGYGQYVIDDSPEGAREALGAIQATSREALDEMRRMLGVLRQQDVTPDWSRTDAGRANGGAGTSESLTGTADRPVTGTGFLTPATIAASADADDDAAAGQLSGVAPGHNRGSPAPLAPAPGLANLDRLIERTSGAGVRVSLEVYGHARPMPAGLDLSAYRIIQEALTNVVKHAGRGARCTVHLGYDEGVLAIRVTDDGGGSTTLPRYGGLNAAGQPARAGLAADERIPAAVGVNPSADLPPRADATRRSRGPAEGNARPAADLPAAASPARNGHGTAAGWRMPGGSWVSAGHGIIGMRERAHLCGGKFSARPLPEGGFQVTASLPLPATPRAEATA